jgi:diguanylate cyclase (GGDEF)-like protein
MLASSFSRSKSAVILVIDPDPESQRRTRERLMEMGYSARSVDDYQSALDVVATTPPDVVLLSGRSTRSSGWEELQTELKRWGIPILTLGMSEETGHLATSPLPGVHAPEVHPAWNDKDLKLRLDAALQSRTLQEALMTENARLTAERLHDPLTGLYNRRYIMIRTEEEIMRSSRRGHPLSCLLIDIDGFEKINEMWGHAVGDAVLRDMAHVVTRTMRATDITCRYRDDQFLILLTDTDASGAQIAANRLRDVVAGHSFMNPMSADEPIKLTASVGISYWQPAPKEDHVGTWEPQLIGLSERALRAAKQSGHNRLVILQAQ